jgi:hypothetical protein
MRNGFLKSTSKWKQAIWPRSMWSCEITMSIATQRMPCIYVLLYMTVSL